MTPLLVLIVLLVAGFGVLRLFVGMDAARLAQLVRFSGPALLALMGAVLLLLGRAAIGGAMLTGAIALYGALARRRRATPTPGRKSTVRTAALEMELDHDSGRLDGMILAGTQEGRMLAELSEAEARALYGEFASDPESLQLLEAYLDGRFPLWRENAQPDDRDRERVAPRSGAMTKEEAYKILGLESGAATADIRKAHRRLMQRLHPDLGGSSFLAARINEAKDILLSDHD